MTVTPGWRAKGEARRIRSILLVGGDLSGGGGVNRVLRDLSAIFAGELKLETTVISARSAAEPTYRFDPAVKVEYHPEGASFFGYLRVLWRMRRRRYDVVVSFWPHDNILMTLIFLFSGSRLILTEHTSWYFPPRWVQLLRLLAYRLAWRVLVLNQAELDYYGRFLRNVRLLSNAVPELEQGKAVPREPLILAVGHVEKRKNFEDAVRAMALSGLERDGWSMAIVGDGPERESLQRLITELGLTRTAIHPPTRDIATWYRRAAILAVTSTLEVFSLVTVEAALAGAVPLAYAADGPAFILADFPEQLVPIGDVPALAAKLRSLATHPELEQLAQGIGASARQRFGVGPIAAQWRELLA
jgi:glycosyltransferase involved in cell wall biosynthesis